MEMVKVWEDGGGDDLRDEDWGIRGNFTFNTETRKSEKGTDKEGRDWSRRMCTYRSLLLSFLSYETSRLILAYFSTSYEK
jgi:hypothetical protein